MKHSANIILDLDQTIISSEYHDRFNERLYASKMKRLHHLRMPGEFVIFQRPHLQEFLDYIFKNFNVSVWTAASRDYGLYIVENFILTKPERHIDFFFYSYHCNFCMKTENKLKPLNVLWDTFGLINYNQNNTMIIDDNWDVYKTQPKNTFMIKEFKYDDPDSEKDDELAKLIVLLKKYKIKSIK
jgi:TFIIF-interacting CTD phosphatase-like protein